MQLTIIKRNKLSIFVLPEKVHGNYWITDFENGKKINLINIEAQEDNWTLVSNNDAFIIDNNEIMVPYTTLKNYSFYLLKNNYKNELYYIYCSPVYDKTYKELGIKSAITVGSDKSCDICYKLGGIPKKAFSIEKKDKYYYLSILDKNASVFVNQHRVFGIKRIEYGDVLFIFGLKVILLRKEGQDLVLVNNPGNLLEFNASFVNVVPIASEFIEDNAVLNDTSIYQDDNYFYRAPHFYKTLEKFVLQIDTPPSKKEDDKTPVALTIGPMITMSMSSVVMLMSTFNSISKGEKDLESATTSIVMGIAMLASCLLWPILTKAYQKFSNFMYERKRQILYRKYINRKEIEIEEQMEIQKKSLLDNNFTVTVAQNIIRGHNVKLWQRRITDEDFLTLPIGFGNMPMQIEIKYPEEHFTLEEDSLLNIAHSLGKKERILEQVPITFSFYKNIATGIIGDSISTKDFIDRLVLQMMANYSYDEVKFVTFTSIDNETSWDYIKMSPHSWSNDKTMRFFGSSNDDYREIMYFLEHLYHERKNAEKSNLHIPHYVIITDAIKSIDNYDFLKEIMAYNENLGFSIIMLVDKISAIPNECKNFITVSKEECTVFSSVINSSNQKFKIDYSSIDDIYLCARELANIPINIKSEAEASLPDVYQFLEMYQVGKIEQLNSLTRWKKSNPILSLQAPIGIGKNKEVITLDIHEKYHGPHGLIAGTTGSGKSEFITSYILSLAVNYHPYEVQVILIDYKGGGLAGVFSSDTYQLPHLAGTITNLDGNELNRSLASIESEIKRRQGLFNEARKVSKESSIDIYKYQKLWREGRLNNMEPIAHLLIISDEFAELKEQQPEFMDKLISVARVGRSLGVHLILATQKPGGVVDSQIWSNTRFRVCLKVQDTADSQEVLKKPDAAYLKKTGRFFLQVGYDEVFTLGQAAWAGGGYYPNTTFKKDIDTSVNVINNIGFVLTSVDAEVQEKVESLGEELPNVVKYLSDIASRENIHIRKLWLDKIPEKIYIDSLKSKYNFERIPYFLNPIIGEYDDPSTQNQYVLNVPFSKNGNVLIYGMAGSGKEMFLSSLIYSCMTSYSSNEVNFYILDFGSEVLRIFDKSPYVGDIAYVNDEDKIKNLFKMLEQKLEERKELFANYGGNYQSYIASKKEGIPNLVIMINNYDAFIENYEDLSDILNQLSREAFKYGIFFVITASNENSIRLKTRQNFSIIYVLEQNNELDYSSILGNTKGKYPSKNIGRGLFKNDAIFEFQTAMITKDNESEYVTNFCLKAQESCSYKAKKIPVLPNVVDFEAVKDYLQKSSKMVIGINKNTLIPEVYDFKKNTINLICSYEIDYTLNFVLSLIDEVTYLGVYDILFVNTTDQAIEKDSLKGRICTKNFDDFLEKIDTYVNKVYDMYEKNGYDDTVLVNQNKLMAFIYGVYDFFNKLNDESRSKLSKLMKNASQIGVVSFVFIDNPDTIKSFAYEDWFKNGCDPSHGIWVGSGISDQSLIKITKIDREDREEISNDYGFIIKTAKLSRVKLLSEFKPK